MREKIIIIGGGFAGLQLARQLSSHKDKKVVLIDQSNHHMFQPLFYQVACARIEPSNISFPFRKIFQHSKSIQFRMTKVVEIKANENTIVTTDSEFKYDKLIIATGCKTNFFGQQSIQEHTLGMKTTEEAIRIRNKILYNFEKLMLERSASDDGNWSIVIVGGGPTGVELAGAFAEMKSHILPRDFPRMNFSALKIILINATPKPLAVMSASSQNSSEKFLKELGVEIINEDKLVSYDSKTVTLESGRTITSNNVIWAAGVTGNVIEGISEQSLYKNRYIVNRLNQIKDYNNIFAIGDIAYMETPQYPNGHPQVANVAINQGQLLGKNFKKNNPSDWEKYEYINKGSMATIGKHRAVVDLPKIHFSGHFAWYVWMFLHLMLILSVRNKLAVFFNWAWSYFNKDSSLRLIFVSPKFEKRK